MSSKLLFGKESNGFPGACDCHVRILSYHKPSLSMSALRSWMPVLTGNGLNSVLNRTAFPPFANLQQRPQYFSPSTSDLNMGMSRLDLFDPFPPRLPMQLLMGI